jgi:hypothetical protein
LVQQSVKDRKSAAKTREVRHRPPTEEDKEDDSEDRNEGEDSEEETPRTKLLELKKQQMEYARKQHALKE